MIKIIICISCVVFILTACNVSLTSPQSQNVSESLSDENALQQESEFQEEQETQDEENSFDSPNDV